MTRVTRYLTSFTDNPSGEIFRWSPSPTFVKAPETICSDEEPGGSLSLVSAVAGQQKRSRAIMEQTYDSRLPIDVLIALLSIAPEALIALTC